jgi:putative Holliday junction resolvase
VRAIGLDIGARRIGVAVSDPAGRVASPVAVLDARELGHDAKALVEMVEDYEAEVLVVGLPLTLGGAEGPQAAEVRVVADRLADRTGVPVEYRDERLSSVEARRVMRDAGMSEREQRGSVDKVAAAIMLQNWLDARKGAAGECR